MPSNIEIKARVADPGRKRELAATLSGGPPAILRQRDTFFHCAHGRLKLRELSSAEGELIAYHRPDTAGAKQSDYSIFRTDSPAALHNVLTMASGATQVVNKTRYLFLAGQTRIHLDDVAGLGWFLELEVVLQAGQTSEDGQRIAGEFMDALEIGENDLIEGAYADLLAALPPAITALPEGRSADREGV